MMKERPILFSAEMVKAILDGRKTMTRRVCKYQPSMSVRKAGSMWGIKGGDALWHFGHKIVSCPYGQPGDQLWVRETWMPFTEQGCPVGATIYRATDHPEPDGDSPLRWNPSIFMPMSASRITLEITAVRVERVQDISADDVQAEGIDVVAKLPVFISPKKSMESLVALSKTIAQSLYKELWDSLNAKRGCGWDANPWVWVLSFKRVKGGE